MSLSSDNSLDDDCVRSGSTCSTSSYDSVSSQISSSSAYEALMMPTPPCDDEERSHKLELSRQRRAWKRDVFDNALVDWKAISAIEVTEHNRDHLLRQPHLRCDSSSRRHKQVIAAARANPLMAATESTSGDENASSSSPHQPGIPEPGKVTIIRDQGLTTVIIDGENIIDMIG